MHSSPCSSFSSLRWGFHLVGFWLLASACFPLFASQAAPAKSLPQEIKGAKVYQLPTKGGQPAPNPAIYKSISFSDINTSRLLLNLSISIKPVDHAATVERIYFQDVRANGIPVHMETFDQEFKLSTKAPVDVPAPIKCSIIFSDLDSMQPLKDMVDKDKILITGESFTEVKLSSLEKLALRARQVVIPVVLNETVPLNFFKDSPFLRMAADTVLSNVTNPSSSAAMTIAKQHLAQTHLDESLGGKVKAALYLLYTEYTVRDPKTNASEQFSQSGTGFLVSADGKLLTSKRVIVPWKFDPSVDFLIEQDHLELDKSSVKTYAWPGGVPVKTADGQPNLAAALSTEKGTLKILQMPPDEMVQQDYHDPDSDQNASLQLHAEGSADLALLQVTGAGLKPLALPDARSSPAINARLVLCSYPLGVSEAELAPRLLSVDVDPQGTLLRMEHKADPGDSGAPLLDSSGNVQAIAASDKVCIPIEAARKLLP